MHVAIYPTFREFSHYHCSSEHFMLSYAFTVRSTGLFYYWPLSLPGYLCSALFTLCYGSCFRVALSLLCIIDHVTIVSSTFWIGGSRNVRIEVCQQMPIASLHRAYYLCGLFRQSIVLYGWSCVLPSTFLFWCSW